MESTTSGGTATPDPGLTPPSSLDSSPKNAFPCRKPSRAVRVCARACFHAGTGKGSPELDGQMS